MRAQRLHAEQQWHHFIRHHDTANSSWLNQSWQMSAPHVSVEQTCAPIDDPETVRREFMRSHLYQLAQPILDELRHAVEDTGFAIGLSDAHATLLLNGVQKCTTSHREWCLKVHRPMS